MSFNTSLTKYVYCEKQHTDKKIIVITLSNFYRIFFRSRITFTENFHNIVKQKSNGTQALRQFNS